MSPLRPTLIPLFALALSAWAQEPIDTAMNARIREEALQHSELMATLQPLADRFSPRLTGSAGYQAAAAWSRDRLAAWGLSRARLEPWPFGHRGWANERCAAHVEAPWQGHLGVEVVAWTPSTQGVARAAAFHLQVPEEPTQEELTAVLEAAKDKVAGRIVLAGALKALPALSPGTFQLRWPDEVVAKFFDPEHPQAPNFPQPKRRPGALEARLINEQVDAFLVANKALARINDSAQRHGQVRAFQNRTYDLTKAVPTLVMRHEDYGRICRVLQEGQEVRLALEITNRLTPAEVQGYNVVAEIPGTDKAAEVILLGAHLDAWHTATGATDNGVNCATMMEVGRILQKLGKPRRTIRIALWDGEEHGLLGSTAYVDAHYGSAESPKVDFGELVAYLNADMGAGQIRGLWAFGPSAAAQVLREILVPFKDLAVGGAAANTARPSRLRTGPSSDQASFSAAGLPSISVMQDGLEYFDYTWHTAIDTLDRVPPEDPKRTAAVLASVAWHLAMREARLPFFTKDTLPPVPPPPSALPKP